ncbi:hypothetical protein STXM2123_4271 [Streptomyces sp. F-3]|nr:hypothetical protein STXM2123_4271 [Streptomyces sp. F-3]
MRVSAGFAPASPRTGVMTTPITVPARRKAPERVFPSGKTSEEKEKKILFWVVPFHYGGI